MKKITLVLLFMSLLACQNKKETATFPSPDWPQKTASKPWGEGISRAVYHDKILGLLVGSAIGDAMGAPTEMWHNSYIRQQVGYVDGLDTHIRTASAEGPWGDFMPAGGTTDDSRWKFLTGQYLLKQGSKPDSLNAKAFGQHIIDQYLSDIKRLKATESFDPEPFEKEMMHVNFLQEWAKVAKPFIANDLEKYSYALDKFYGGEMVCGGMLYAPLLGGVFPSNPEKAYLEAYRLGFFDLGFARDISGLTAAMVSAGFKANAKPDDITVVCRDTDPLKYHTARLTGRIAFRAYTDAKGIIDEAQKATVAVWPQPKNYKGSPQEWAIMTAAFKALEAKQQDMPFHAAEIHLINLTALEYAKGDFQKAMEFVVNFGRDNDTVGAVTGGILGAYLGFEKLPKIMREQSLKTNKEIGHMDFQKMADDLTDLYFGKE